MHRHVTSLLLCALVAPLTAFAGCGHPTDASLEKLNKAQAVLEADLDAWTRKASPERLTDADPDFKAGYRLSSFLTSEAKPVEGTTDQFRFRVALALADQRGVALDRDVFYVVRLGEPIAIRREEAVKGK